MALSARDICSYRHERYLKERDDHSSQSVGPDGKTHSVDILRLLCLGEMVDYGLTLVGADADVAGVYSREPIAAGDIVTFYPGDAAGYYPEADNPVSVRLPSDRVRLRLGVHHELSLVDAFDAGDGFRVAGNVDFADDPNYLGHLIATGADSNCKLQVQAGGIAVAVIATKDIPVGEQLYY